MKILAIDPGETESAYVVYDVERRRPLAFDTIENRSVLDALCGGDWASSIEHMAIEMVASYGMSVGREVFETVFWIGRFVQAWPNQSTRLYRRDVKMHLTNSNRAKDANVRQALIDRFGPGKAAAIGVKKTPGPLYGVHSDIWSALALAVTWADAHQAKTNQRDRELLFKIGNDLSAADDLLADIAQGISNRNL